MYALAFFLWSSSWTLAKETKYGFRDIEFGSSCRLHEDFDGFVEKTKKSKNVIIYHRPKDMLTLGKVDLEYIEYYCWKDQFYKVDINYANVGLNTRNLLLYLNKKWGYPGRSEDTRWEYRKKDFFAIMVPGILQIYSQELYRKKRKKPDGGL